MNKKIISKIIFSILLLTSLNVNAEYNYASINKKCQAYDPYETINRGVFMFNGALDTIVLRPIAKGYGKFTNDYVKARVGSFNSNFTEPLSTVNYAFQGKGEGVLKSFWKFAINSTLGVGGLFDVAGKFGLNSEKQNFEHTLAHHGVGAGPYIVLPLYGPTSGRGLLDTPVLNSKLNPLGYFMHSDFKYARSGVAIVHTRSKIMPFTDHITKHSPDPYIAMRQAYLNSRESKMAYTSNFVCPVAQK